MEAHQMTRLRLYMAAIAVGFAAAWQVIRLIRKDAVRDMERERVSRRVDAMKVAQEVRDEVEILDDTGLADRASKWLRK